MAIEYITTPASAITTLSNAIILLFTELENLALADTELTPTMIASGGTGITKGLAEIIGDFVNDCYIDDNT
jgi:hypothetical protein